MFDVPNNEVECSSDDDEPDSSNEELLNYKYLEIKTKEDKLINKAREEMAYRFYKR